jgi:diacylglycerol kinase (ATP)
VAGPDARPADHARPSTAFVIGRIRRGHHVAAVVHEVERLLADEGVRVHSKIVWKKKQVRRATARALDAGVDLVIAVGGDGTVQQVADSVAGTRVPLAIVPTGTGNLLAGNLGIAHEPEDAVRIALSGRPRRIDVGRFSVGGKRRIFTVACGVGFDADVMDRTDSAGKSRWGKVAYLASAFLESGKIRNVTHDITIDGVTGSMEAAQVFVVNFGRVSGLRVRGVKADDGLLDVFVMRASGPLPALLAGWEAIRDRGLGEHDGGRIFRAKARKVRIETRPRRRVETDGSVVGRTPVTLSVRKQALTVMVPRRSADASPAASSAASAASADQAR